MNNLDYYRHEALNDYPGTIAVDDLPEVVAGMVGGELTEMRQALIALDEEAIGRLIINTIQRQHAEQIEMLAAEYLEDYLDGLKDEAENSKDEVRNDNEREGSQ